MELNGLLLVWSVNLFTGAGLLLLGVVMRRRPDRVWVGMRPVSDPGEVARVRRANAWTYPWLLLLGSIDVLSGPVALLAGIQPLTLAFIGLIVLICAILVLVMAALFFRREA